MVRWCAQRYNLLRSIAIRRTSSDFYRIKKSLVLRGVSARFFSSLDPMELTSQPFHNIPGSSSPSQDSTMLSNVAGKVEKGKVIVISGPTASGKTRLGLWLAEKLDGEIISADSVQVYRGLDVGSAKTPFSERQGVPHHMIDIAEVSDEYSAGDFYVDARRATAEVISRGKVPIVVGGTGLYLRWYLYGKPDTPRVTNEVTTAVSSLLTPLMEQGENGWQKAVQILKDKGDLLTGEQVAQNDWYRLARAFEILMATGKARHEFPVPSSRQLAHPPYEEATLSEAQASSGLDVDFELDFDFRCFFLCPPREDLYRRIDLRCEEMVESGILEEAHDLLTRGFKPNSFPASRAIGYRQALEYLMNQREGDLVNSEEEFFKFLGNFQQASRNFAKRQMIWFRGERLYKWLDSSLPLEDLGKQIEDNFNSEFGTGPNFAGVEEGEARERSYRDGKKMKFYRTKLEIFSDKERVRKVLQWVDERL